MSDVLTTGESLLVDQAARGGFLSIDLAAMSEPVIRATILREVLLDAGSELVSTTLSHALIRGRLDLRDARVDAALHLHNVEFDHCPVFADAQLRALSFVDCVLPGSDLHGAAVDQTFVINGGRVTDCLRLDRARLGRGMRCSDLEIISEDTAISADLDPRRWKHARRIRSGRGHRVACRRGH